MPTTEKENKSKVYLEAIRSYALKQSDVEGVPEEFKIAAEILKNSCTDYNVAKTLLRCISVYLEKDVMDILKGHVTVTPGTVIVIRDRKNGHNYRVGYPVLVVASTTHASSVDGEGVEGWKCENLLGIEVDETDDGQKQVRGGNHPPTTPPSIRMATTKEINQLMDDIIENYDKESKMKRMGFDRLLSNTVVAISRLEKQ